MARMGWMTGMARMAAAVPVAVFASVALAAARGGRDLGALVNALRIRRARQGRDLRAVPLAVLLRVLARIRGIVRAPVNGAHGGVGGRPRGCLRRCLPLESGLGGR